MRGNLAKVASRRDFTDSGFVMSVETISESAIFSESAVSLRVSAFRPARTILAPASDRSSQMARPIPGCSGNNDDLVF